MENITNVRFRWINEEGNDFLIEAKISEFRFGCEIIRIEPEYYPEPLEMMHISSLAFDALSTIHIPKYFSDEHEKAFRDLEIEAFRANLCRIDYERAQKAFDIAEARLIAVRWEIEQKFKKHEKERQAKEEQAFG